MPVEYIDIDDQEDCQQRIDNFLLRRLKGVPRSHVYRILRSGEVRINGGRVRASYRLSLGDRVRIPPIRRRDEVPVTVNDSTRARLEAAVIYESDDLLILNKPAGLAVHGGSGLAAGVIEQLRVTRGSQRLALIHRLDRDTSGCLAIAKNRRTLVEAQNAFRDRRVQKSYALFVRGLWPKRKRRVQLKLKRFQTQSGERRVRVDSAGQTAVTDFEVIEQSARVSWLQATLHTGRTHQIRVHTSASGFPIIGDDKYGGATERSTEQRLCLHAERLQLPVFDDLIKVSAPLPEDLRLMWQGLTG